MYIGSNNDNSPDMSKYRTTTAQWVQAYSKTRKSIMSSTKEEHLEACLKMVEYYERFMLDFGPTSVQGKELTVGTVNDLLSLIRIKRRLLSR